jgi:hypothetical protein
MGIRKYHQKYRAAIRVDGKDVQPYFDDRTSAESFLKEAESKKEKQLPFVGKNKKRSNAKAKDLPVGLTQTKTSKLVNDTLYEYSVIRSIIHYNRIYVGTVSTMYGNKYSRKEAIELTIKKREKKITEFKIKNNI